MPQNEHDTSRAASPVLIPPPEPRDPEHVQLTDLERLARWMDSVFHIPGTTLRFGIDSIVGLIFGPGDLATSLVSLYILQAAAKYQVPRTLLLRMAANVAVDYLVGSVPVLGDAFDFYWKANQRNVALLRSHLEATPAEERRARRGDWVFLGVLIGLLVLLLAGSIAIAALIVYGVGRLLF